MVPAFLIPISHLGSTTPPHPPSGLMVQEWEGIKLSFILQKHFADVICVIVYPYSCHLVLYSARAQDGPQEMERNQATAMHVAWPNCSWLLLSFSPYPMGHPKHEHASTVHKLLNFTHFHLLLNYISAYATQFWDSLGPQSWKFYQKPSWREIFYHTNLWFWGYFIGKWHSSPKIPSMNLLPKLRAVAQVWRLKSTLLTSSHCTFVQQCWELSISLLSMELQKRGSQRMRF